ncbi:MAG: hypothetical protein JSV61_06125 [Anaerolineales bacterium]|nr:MAG: hypothetical protein JSV61_06125 [Anaerolineales bacterium]
MKPELIQSAYTAITKHFIQRGRAPHYTELAQELGLSPDTARELQRVAAESVDFGSCWMNHDTDYIEAWGPFSSLPTHHLVSVEGIQKWYAV